MRRRVGAAMTDLLTATHDAVVAALEGSAALVALAPVYSNVPPETQPPFVELGAIEAEEANPTKMPGVERHRIELAFQHRGPSRRPLLAMMQAARAALEDRALTAAGASLARVKWTESATDREEDGVTWHGAMSFELLAQQA